MRDENGVGACLRGRRHQRAKCLGAAIIPVWRHDETAFGEIGRLLDVLKAGKHGGLVAAIVFTGVNLADRDADLTQRIAELLWRASCPCRSDSAGRRYCRN